MAGLKKRKQKTRNNRQGSKKKILRRVVAHRKVVSKRTGPKKTPLRRALRVLRKKQHPVLARHYSNPIITPSQHEWEARATFNPAAVEHNGTTHILYRAIGSDDRSVLGYASSRDGVSITQRLSQPAYDNAQGRAGDVRVKIPYSSGGGTNGGCEDPRITIIDNRAYLIYTAFDGWGSLRLAMSSISVDDFINQRWSWDQPVMISPPGQIHKNWVLFPEKINNQYALLTSVSPVVQIAYFTNLKELDGAHFVQSAFGGGPKRKGVWDSWVRGVGPPPMKTDYGWLVLYHAMDLSDPNRYKLGAMLLDLKDPSQILYRAQQPVLEPDEQYENNGFKRGVVYCCGAVVKNGQLIVYYGGADTVGCVATASFSDFVQQLMTTGKPQLKIRK
jgi:beta-1,2-mannobiose phosphorylase / 1,2-beta-oligomannan phosphorylase